jgi:hypothetical protein
MFAHPHQILDLFMAPVAGLGVHFWGNGRPFLRGFGRLRLPGRENESQYHNNGKNAPRFTPHALLLSTAKIYAAGSVPKEGYLEYNPFLKMDVSVFRTMVLNS